MRRAAKVDSTQAEIVVAFRRRGAAVWSTAQLGNGFPDLIVCIRAKSGLWRTLLVEVKDGSLSPSKRALTADEARFHAFWPGELRIVGSADEALALCHEMAE